jgi:ubiquitin
LKTTSPYTITGLLTVQSHPLNTVFILILLENTISLTLRLLGGKKKRKKKVYTKPKKIGHKHKKRPKALLEYFNVDTTGKISKLKIECEKCPAGN